MSSFYNSTIIGKFREISTSKCGRFIITVSGTDTSSNNVTNDNGSIYFSSDYGTTFNLLSLNLSLNIYTINQITIHGMQIISSTEIYNTNDSDHDSYIQLSFTAHISDVPKVISTMLYLDKTVTNYTSIINANSVYLLFDFEDDYVNKAVPANKTNTNSICTNAYFGADISFYTPGFSHGNLRYTWSNTANVLTMANIVDLYYNYYTSVSYTHIMIPRYETNGINGEIICHGGNLTDTLRLEYSYYGNSYTQTNAETIIFHDDGELLYNTTLVSFVDIGSFAKGIIFVISEYIGNVVHGKGKLYYIDYRKYKDTDNNYTVTTVDIECSSSFPIWSSSCLTDDNILWICSKITNELVKITITPVSSSVLGFSFESILPNNNVFNYPFRMSCSGDGKYLNCANNFYNNSLIQSKDYGANTTSPWFSNVNNKFSIFDISENYMIIYSKLNYNGSGIISDSGVGSLWLSIDSGSTYVELILDDDISSDISDLHDLILVVDEVNATNRQISICLVFIDNISSGNSSYNIWTSLIGSFTTSTTLTQLNTIINALSWYEIGNEIGSSFPFKVYKENSVDGIIHWMRSTVTTNILINDVSYRHIINYIITSDVNYTTGAIGSETVKYNIVNGLYNSTFSGNGTNICVGGSSIQYSLNNATSISAGINEDVGVMVIASCVSSDAVDITDDIGELFGVVLNTGDVFISNFVHSSNSINLQKTTIAVGTNILISNNSVAPVTSNLNHIICNESGLIFVVWSDKVVGEVYVITIDDSNDNVAGDGISYHINNIGLYSNIRVFDIKINSTKLFACSSKRMYVWSDGNDIFTSSSDVGYGWLNVDDSKTDNNIISLQNDINTEFINGHNGKMMFKLGSVIMFSVDGGISYNQVDFTWNNGSSVITLDVSKIFGFQFICSVDGDVLDFGSDGDTYEFSVYFFYEFQSNEISLMGFNGTFDVTGFGADTIDDLLVKKFSTSTVVGRTNYKCKKSKAKTNPHHGVLCKLQKAGLTGVVGLYKFNYVNGGDVSDGLIDETNATFTYMDHADLNYFITGIDIVGSVMTDYIWIIVNDNNYKIDFGSTVVGAIFFYYNTENYVFVLHTDGSIEYERVSKIISSSSIDEELYYTVDDGSSLFDKGVVYGDVYGDVEQNVCVDIVCNKLSCNVTYDVSHTDGEGKIMCWSDDSKNKFVININSTSNGGDTLDLTYNSMETDMSIGHKLFDDVSYLSKSLVVGITDFDAMYNDEGGVSCFVEGCLVGIVHDVDDTFFNVDYVRVENLYVGDFVHCTDGKNRKIIDLCKKKLNKSNQIYGSDNLRVIKGHSILGEQSDCNELYDESHYVDNHTIDNNLKIMPYHHKDFKLIHLELPITYYHFVLEYVDEIDQFGCYNDGYKSETMSKYYYDRHCCEKFKYKYENIKYKYTVKV